MMQCITAKAVAQQKKLCNNEAMKKSTAIKKAGSQAKLAEILGIKQQSVQKWPDEVPALREYQLREKKPEWFQKGGKK